MTTNEIKEFSTKIDQLIERRQLSDVFDTLHNAAKSISSWSISDRIEKAEQGYSYMLKYMIDGVNDPSRDNVYSDLIREASTLRDILIREMSLTDTPTLYYNTLRSVNSHREETLSGLFSGLRNSIDSMSPFNSMQTGAIPSQSDKLRAEMIERDIFNRLWTSFPMNVDDARLTAEFISDDSIPFRSRALCVSALTLSLLNFLDDRKLALLLDAYQVDEPHISIRAITGIAIVLDKYKGAELSRETINRLKATKELPQWHTDLHRVIVELIRTTDTRRISAKINDEIFPKIKRMGENLTDNANIKFVDPDNQNDEINPEWKAMLSDQNIIDNLKELGELQQEGADVFMTTFSSLKQFPFFNETANWFMPFDPEHSSLSSSPDGQSTLSTLIAAAPFVCDSDKYSMALSMAMMPESQRSAMASQLDSHSNEISEILAATDRNTMPVDRKTEINNYIHSLYRFFHLFRRKGDFYNPFGHVANPVDQPFLASDFDSEEALLSLGEFYFKIGLYSYASSIFSKIDEMSAPEAARYQKLGYCAEKLGNIDQASSYYEQADLLDGASIWNLKRLMSVYRRLGNYSSAISVCQRLEKRQPDNPDIAVDLGSLYILAGNFKAAIAPLQKAEFMNPDSIKPLRPLAWASLICRDYDIAQSYYDRILASDPTPVDLLNSGHLAWARGRLGEAINYYRLSAERTSLDHLSESIRNDIDHLSKAGVDVSAMPMMIDAVICSMKK